MRITLTSPSFARIKDDHSFVDPFVFSPYSWWAFQRSLVPLPWTFESTATSKGLADDMSTWGTPGQAANESDPRLFSRSLSLMKRKVA